MKNMLKFEFAKWKKQKSFYIFLGVLLAMTLISILTIKAIMWMDDMMDLEMMAMMGYTSESMTVAAAANSSITMILGLYVAMTACQDYGQQTIKNVYARGYSRTKVYFGKMLIALFSMTIMYVAVVLFNWLLSGAFFGFTWDHVGKTIVLLLGQYVICLAFLGLYFMFCHLFRKTGPALVLSLVAPMVLEIVFVFIDIFTMELNPDFAISALWLSGMLSRLSSLTVGNGWIVGCTIGGLAYALLFFGLGYLFSCRAEL